MLIYDLNGNLLHDLEDYGIYRLFHRIQAIEVEDNAEVVEGRDGDIPSPDMRYASRSIGVDFAFIVKDIYDFYLMRSQVTNALTSRKDLIVIFKREPYIRWRVRRLSAFDIEPNPKGGTFTVDFKCSKVRGESTHSTLEMMNGDYTEHWDEDMFAWDNTIAWDDSFIYKWDSGSNFLIDNKGNSIVNPRYDQLKISLSPSIAIDNITIQNRTTGEEVVYHGSIQPHQTLHLDGVRIFLDGISVFENTNHKLLTLVPGINDILILTNNQYRVELDLFSADFRFMYE